jgi:hypothetical protein
MSVTYNASVALFQVALVLVIAGLGMLHAALCRWWDRDTARRAYARAKTQEAAAGWQGQ